MLEEPSREDAPSQDQEQGSVLSCIHDVDEHNHDHHIVIMIMMMIRM